MVNVVLTNGHVLQVPMSPDEFRQWASTAIGAAQGTVAPRPITTSEGSMLLNPAAVAYVYER